MDIVLKIRQLCAQKSISFAELERILGFSNGQIARWNKANPGIDKVKKVADFFDVSIDYLIGNETKDYGTMFRMNTDGFSEEDTKELIDELEKYQSMYRLLILERKKREGK